ncbi:MAG: flavodoxin family protein [Lachnospiraceae bacterium]|nr:flavodoxin family protein [Lachnospiraceae bacterium]
MKIVAVNGGPRKKCNTGQLMEAFLKGVKAAAPDAEIEEIHLYDYLYTGCKSCFACQMTVNREELGCRIKDNITEALQNTFHADGIVFASPIYYLNVSAQLRAFWERLLYPGHSPKTIPTAIIYTMNMNEEQEKQYAASPLEIIDMYLNGCFGMPPETIHSYNTFQYNDRPNLNEEFRSMVEEKKKHHDEQFPIDLQKAFEAGENLVRRVIEVAALQERETV